MSETFDLRIDSIAAGGDGVGRRNGHVVFVPRTAPGDLARVSAEQHDRLMRGRLLQLLEASDAREEPPCQHYVVDRCGGCQLQHLGYGAQLRAKASIVREALARIGRVTIDQPDIEESEKPWRYRTKLTLALRRQDNQWIAGLHRFDTLDVFALDDCLITDQAVLHAWESILAQQELLPRAKELRGAVRLLTSGFSFTLEGGRDWAGPKRAEFFAAITEMVELWWKPSEKSRRLVESRARDEAGASFVQVNPGVASKLRDWVVARATALRPSTAIDAYAGTGDIAVALAEQGTRVTAIEIDRDAARVAASRLPNGSRAIAAPVEEALSRALPADVVILNPPRAGVDARVIEALKAGPADAGTPRSPRAVLYVSCNPATLARDVRRLESYRVESLQAFDMFPQTAHVEAVCELVPNHA